MSALNDIQRWYHAQCNGDWEHSYGMRIDTLDNPGWGVKIDLAETLLEDRPFDPVRRGVSDEGDDDANWIDCKVEGRRFVGYGGPHQLDEILQTFITWAQSLPDWLDTPTDQQMAARADREFLNALGEEVGPELCCRPGCDRRRIHNSVLCRVHQYEQVKGLPPYPGGT